MKMKFKDVTDSRLKTLNLFEAVTNPLLPFDFMALKIGFSTTDKELQKAFKAKLKVFKAENTDYEQLVRPAFKKLWKKSVLKKK